MKLDDERSDLRLYFEMQLVMLPLEFSLVLSIQVFHKLHTEHRLDPKIALQRSSHLEIRMTY